MVATQQIDDHALYPAYTSDYVPEQPAPERQVRYLRDALSVLLKDDAYVTVTGNHNVLGWTGSRTEFLAPDVLVFTEFVERGWSGPEPHPIPNPHPFERNRRFDLVIDVTGRYFNPRAQGPVRPEAHPWFGFEAYLHFNLETHEITAARLVDGAGLVVPRQPDGRYLFADVRVGFKVDEEGFLRVVGYDGTVMPRYDEVVPRNSTPEDLPRAYRDESSRPGRE